MDAGMELARRLCKGPTGAIGATKRILNQSFNLGARALVETEAGVRAIFFHSELHKAAIAGFLENKRFENDWDRFDDPK